MSGKARGRWLALLVLALAGCQGAPIPSRDHPLRRAKHQVERGNERLSQAYGAAGLRERVNGFDQALAAFRDARECYLDAIRRSPPPEHALLWEEVDRVQRLIERCEHERPVN